MAFHQARAIHFLTVRQAFANHAHHPTVSTTEQSVGCNILAVVDYHVAQWKIKRAYLFAPATKGAAHANVAVSLERFQIRQHNIGYMTGEDIIVWSITNGLINWAYILATSTLQAY